MHMPRSPRVIRTETALARAFESDSTHFVPKVAPPLTLAVFERIMPERF